MMNTKRYLTVRFLLLGLTVAVFAACSPDAEEEADEEEDRLAVEMEEAEQTGITEVINLSGEIEPSRTVGVIPDQAGEVVELFVEIGDRVEKDEVIARVDPSRPGQRFAVGPVRSPIAGTITQLNMREGSNVSQQSPVAQVASIDDLEISTYVPERFIGGLSLGQQAAVRLDALPGEEFSASVVRLAPQLDRTSRSLGTTMVFDTPDPRIRPGMFARIDLIAEERPDAVTVPQRAVVRRADERHVFIVDEDDRAERRPVELGIEADGRVEIVEGLEPGDRVVTRGQNLASQGALLQVTDFDIQESE